MDFNEKINNENNLKTVSKKLFFINYCFNKKIAADFHILYIKFK
jgi:hypothetical protein